MASRSRTMARSAFASLASASTSTASRRAAVQAPRAFSTTTTLGPRSTTKSPYANRKTSEHEQLTDEIKVLPPTQYHTPTHNHHVATLTLSGYSSVPVIKENIVFFTDFAVRAAYAMGIPVSGPAPTKLRKELWTVLKGPFVHKKAQENFERITSKRIVKVFDTNEEVVDRWLHYLRIHAMPGVDMKAELLKRRPVGYGKANFEAARAVLAQSRQRVVSEGEGKQSAGAVEGSATSEQSSTSSPTPTPSS